METTQISNDDKTQLLQLGEKILREAGIDFKESNNNESARYAVYYLNRCWNNSKMINEADASVYQQLVDIDLKQKVDAAEQLTCCLRSTTRADLIEVWKSFYFFISKIR